MAARLFVAVLPPQSVIADLTTFLTPRWAATGEDDVVRWTRPETWHVTVGFLPSVTDDRYERLLEPLLACAGSHAPFDLRLAGAGAFPSVDRARHLWLRPVDTHDALPTLARGVRAAGTIAGVQVEGGRFRPHVTLARLRQPTDATRWLRVLDCYAGAAWTVSDLALVESHLGQGPRGTARYELRERLPLRSA